MADGPRLEAGMSLTAMWGLPCFAVPGFLQGCQISDDTAKALSPEELEAKQMKHLAQSLLPRDVNVT